MFNGTIKITISCTKILSYNKCSHQKFSPKQNRCTSTPWLRFWKSLELGQKYHKTLTKSDTHWLQGSSCEAKKTKNKILSFLNKKYPPFWYKYTNRSRIDRSTWNYPGDKKFQILQGINTSHPKCWFFSFTQNSVLYTCHFWMNSNLTRRLQIQWMKTCELVRIVRQNDKKMPLGPFSLILRALILTTPK